MAHSKNTIWNLVQLGHELDEIVGRLDSLATQFNRGIVDNELYRETHYQIKKCDRWLGHAFRSDRRTHT
jgi:hypothetical protein